MKRVSYPAILNKCRKFAAVHTDPETGRVDEKTLAESACAALLGYDGDAVPTVYFEAAFDVALEMEAI